MNTDTDTTPTSGTTRKPVRIFPWVNGIVATLALAFIAFVWLHKPTAPGGYHYYGTYVGKSAPDFTLTGQDGKPVQLSSFRGKTVLMTFGFTHCPNICPTTLGNLAAVYRGLSADEQKAVQVIFISVDPERDTPGVLKDYVPFFQKGFIGVTGTQEQLSKVAKDYGAFFEKQFQASDHAADYYTINHSPYIYLINPGGKFDVVYDNDKFADARNVTADIRHEIAASPAQ